MAGVGFAITDGKVYVEAKSQFQNLFTTTLYAAECADHALNLKSSC